MKYKYFIEFRYLEILKLDFIPLYYNIIIIIIRLDYMHLVHCFIYFMLAFILFCFYFSLCYLILL